LNRTTLELKLEKLASLQDIEKALNRTTLELKLKIHFRFFSAVRAL